MICVGLRICFPKNKNYTHSLALKNNNNKIKWSYILSLNMAQTYFSLNSKFHWLTCLLLQVIGALWYIFAIQREIACWQYACQSENGCEPNTFRCDDSSVRNVTVLNELCPINPPNATLFNFGIFVDALQYSVLQSTNFPDRFLNCFWWGLRHLRFVCINIVWYNLVH